MEKGQLFKGKLRHHCSEKGKVGVWQGKLKTHTHTQNRLIIPKNI